MLKISEMKEASIDAIARSLNTLCDDQPFRFGWYLKDLGTGESAARNGTMVFTSASTRKIAILAAALKKVTEGHMGTILTG